jgi:hypothetical protein
MRLANTILPTAPLVWILVHKFAPFEEGRSELEESRTLEDEQPGVGGLRKSIEQSLYSVSRQHELEIFALFAGEYTRTRSPSTECS